MSDYTIRRYTNRYEMIELNEAGTDSKVTLCPERGGIATSCILGGRELFYLDEATLHDPSANIRGGNPVLFPVCGTPKNNRYEWEGRVYAMKQHGLARDMAWQVASTSEDGEARVSLRLGSNPETLAVYPFEFELIFDYVLKNGELRIEQTYRNAGTRPMPFYAGVHPYFAAEDAGVRYETDGSTLLGSSNWQEKPLTGLFEADKLEESEIITDAKRPAIVFWPTEGERVTLTYSPVFRYVVLWSLPGKPFVCVEPWMALQFDETAGQGLQIVGPGDSLRADVTIGRR